MAAQQAQQQATQASDAADCDNKVTLTLGVRSDAVSGGDFVVLSIATAGVHAGNAQAGSDHSQSFQLVDRSDVLVDGNAEGLVESEVSACVDPRSAQTEAVDEVIEQHDVNGNEDMVPGKTDSSIKRWAGKLKKKLSKLSLSGSSAAHVN